MGGNLFLIKENGEPKKLHSLGDRSLSNHERTLKQIKQQALQLLSNNSMMPSAFDGEAVSSESFKLSAERVHLNGTLKGSKNDATALELPQGYGKDMEKLAQGRCLLGGKNLSIILNNLNMFFEHDKGEE